MKRNNSVFNFEHSEKSRFWRSQVLIILGIFLFLNIFAWIAVYDLSQPRFLEVIFFDVGQGDAMFIECSEIPHRV